MNNLASLYRDQGKYAEAEPLYMEALAGHKKALGHDHPDTLTTMNNLAMLYQNESKYADAEPSITFWPVPFLLYGILVVDNFQPCGLFLW